MRSWEIQDEVESEGTLTEISLEIKSNKLEVCVKHNASVWIVAHTLRDNSWEAETSDIYEFEASLIYIGSFRPAQARQCYLE